MLGDNSGNLGIHRVWLQPFEPKVLGGLRRQINQFSDPTTTILTPKKQGKSVLTDQAFTYLSQ